MKICTVNIDEKDLPEELKMLLDMGKDGNGEEVFGYLMDDMLYLAALIDMQCDFLRIAKLQGGKLVTSGGRVLGISATAPTLQTALADAYEAAETITFDGKFMRRDIGRRALAAMEER